MLDAGCWMPDAGCRMRRNRKLTRLDVKGRVGRSGIWYLVSGIWYPCGCLFRRHHAEVAKGFDDGLERIARPQAYRPRSPDRGIGGPDLAEQ